jgi:uncharacterized protein
VSREFPDWINPWAAAQARREFRGTLPLERMRRLVPLLADSSGEARFECRLLLDSEGRPVIHLQVTAEVSLRCQASLEIYRQPVERYSELGVIGEDSEESLLPGHLEPVLAFAGRLALIDLVEDELILAMPQVPRKPDFEPRVREFGGRGELGWPGSGSGSGPGSGRGPEREPDRDAEPGSHRKSGRRPFADLARLLDREKD